jgi:hypothetical protein
MIERLLALHDQQFSEAPMHRCTEWWTPKNNCANSYAAQARRR